MVATCDVEVEVSNLKQQSTESSLLKKTNWNAELCVYQWAISAGQHERGGQFPWLTFWGKIGIIFLNIPIMANHQEGQRQCERGDTRHTERKKKTNRWRAGNNFWLAGPCSKKVCRPLLFTNQWHEVTTITHCSLTNDIKSQRQHIVH